MSNIEENATSLPKVPSQKSKTKQKKQSQTGNEVSGQVKGTTTTEKTSGAKTVTTTWKDDSSMTEKTPGEKPAENSELLQFGSMIANSMTRHKETIAQQFEQLQSTLTRPYDEGELSEWSSDEESSYSNSNGGKRNRTRSGEPKSKRRRDISPSFDSSNSGKEENEDHTKKSTSKTSKDSDVLTSIAERLINKEATDNSINEQLAKLINELMFKSKKPDETKMKEETEKILHPENCESVVITKLDELILNRLHSSTRLFDSRVQTAQYANQRCNRNS